MPEHGSFQAQFTRRALLKSLQCAPLLFLPAPLKCIGQIARPDSGSWVLGDVGFTPHYPASSPLDQMLRLVSPAADRFSTEKYAAEIESALQSWSQAITSGTTADVLPALLHVSLIAGSPRTLEDKILRQAYGITASRQKCSSDETLGREQFINEFGKYLGSFVRISVAEFQITSIREVGTSPTAAELEIRYTLVGDRREGGREQRIGRWGTQWISDGDNHWHATKWQTLEESVSRAEGPIFIDVTAQAFGNLPSYREQMLRGTDYWRTVLDGACGIDIYGNQGIAVGDYDGDGFDDIYVCQPSGLPNRLYHNRGNGTFEEATDASGLGVLDATSCALFADFDNKGRQDLLVVTNTGPLLFVNNGDGKFSLKRDAFQFATTPRGTFTHAAIADYDRDGRLDVYFCLYNYYAGLDQYRYPSPYFDAQNGPPNFLLRNMGSWKFEDVTDAARLSVDNDRYSFACAWGDANGNGWPDLYVANDFGRSNLYRNNGDGTFSSVAAEAGVEDVGAGMSATWLDTTGDGRQDIYVGNMWSAAGLRLSQQADFHRTDPDAIRAMYQRHARGNSLYKNLGNGRFRNIAANAGVEFGRWAWSSDSWDFDHDGNSDLYIANGYISGNDAPELSSFFWRQVVGNSPQTLAPKTDYEHAWNAINELIRSGHSWSGRERNVIYANNQDGSFADISGISGLDFPDDSRAFAFVDLDNDGRLEIILKNRDAPQLRVLRNALPRIGNSVVLNLSGTKSNRDAIGAAVTIECAGRRQTKYLQAGSGFLSQHTKELFFGIGDAHSGLNVSIRWPNGTVQNFQNVPANHRVEIIEGSPDFHAHQFSSAASGLMRPASPAAPLPIPTSVETWLLQPLHAPGFSLLDTTGKKWDLHSIHGNRLIVFWSSASEQSRDQLRSLAAHETSLKDVQVLALNVDDPVNESALRAFAVAGKFPFPLLSGTSDVVGIYNIVFRYLFDRHHDLRLPTSFLADATGACVKVYQGVFDPRTVARDIPMIPRTTADRIARALPFPGTLHLGDFQRNDFTYGVAFFQRGYLDAAGDSFQQVIAAKPDNSEAYYNLGTLCLRRKQFGEARTYLEKAVQLKPSHAEAWNNLGMIAAESGKTDEAVSDFKQSLRFRPEYAIALLNLGNIYRRQRMFADAEQLLIRAAQTDANSPEAPYSLGMLYAQQNDNQHAQEKFQDALKLRPAYADALNNYGVLLVREQRYSDAEQEFQQCIHNNPDFDQAYMNLARLYVLQNDKPKARAVLEALLRHQPDHQMAQQALKMLQ
jgi:Flp pilus assembly protein TadD/peroxiredoxin